MSAWSLYFIAKLALYWNQAIPLHWLPNLLFAIALAWPLHQPRWRLMRHIAAVPVAIALAYHDSYLPAPARLLSLAGGLAAFTPAYALELAQRVVTLRLLLAATLGVIAYSVLHRRIRFATFVLLALLAVPLLPAPGSQENVAAAPNGSPVTAAAAGPLRLEQLEQTLNDFYMAERGKTVNFAGSTPAFDLLFLSVCSLSWDDLDEVKLRNAPLLSRFDILFTQFNSAASYSGPAVLRLLHGSCGQGTQNALYEPVPDSCYLFRNLAAAGYQPALLMNHDGHFDKFAQQLTAQGGMGVAPTDSSAAPVAMSSFDGTPIRADFDVLSQWWRQHATGEMRQALLYNTITMHDGNRVPGLQSQHSRDTYQPRITRLFADLDRFLTLVEASGRPTVIVLVPEHGGAIRGDAVQVSGLREIPTPAITNVPVAVKLIGFAGLAHGAAPLRVDKPASYLALTSLIAGLMQAGTGLAGREQLEALVQNLPATEWVAENDGTVLLRRDGRAFLRPPDGQWTGFGAGR
jgi:cellulose synthase operon protein YhjU